VRQFETDVKPWAAYGPPAEPLPYCEKCGGLCVCDHPLQSDPVNHPSHYTTGSIECIEAIKASMTPDAFRGYCKGNVMKYVWRYEQKGGVESLRKANVYLNWLIETFDA